MIVLRRDGKTPRYI
jgi:hypothetical protein